MDLEKMEVQLTADTSDYEKKMGKAADTAKETEKKINSTKPKINPVKAVKEKMNAVKQTVAPKTQSVANTTANDYSGKNIQELKTLEKQYKQTYLTAQREIEKTKKQMITLDAEIEAARQKHIKENYEGLPFTTREKSDMAIENLSRNKNMSGKINKIDILSTKYTAQEAELERARVEYEKIANALNKVSSSAASAKTNMRGVGSSGKDADITYSRFQGINRALNTMRSRAGTIKTLKSNIKSLQTDSLHLSKTLSRVSRVISTMVIRRGLMYGINMIREGFENLCQYSSEANGEISGLKSSLTQMKNSLAAAFLPVVQAIMPILQKLIGWLTIAINAVGQFFAALQGKTTYTKAVAVQEDYAASLKQSTTAAKELKEATAGFDEINTLDSGNKDSGSSGYTGPSPSQMFVTEEIDNKMVALGRTIVLIIGLFAALKVGLMAYNAIAAITAIATGAISWPILLVIAAIAALIAIIVLCVLNWDKIKETATKCVDAMKVKWNEFKDWFGGIVDSFKNRFDMAVAGMKGSWTRFKIFCKSTLSNIWEIIKSVASSIASAFTEPFKKAITAIKQMLNGDLKGGFINLAKAICEIFTKVFNFVGTLFKAIIEGIGKAIDKLKSATGSGPDSSYSIPKNSGSSYSIPKFATGGFPEDGLFMANHGELVGNFANGKTAVANNQQIVEGIQSGVFKAVSAALRQNSGNNEGKEAIINASFNIDGNTYFKAQTKAEKQYRRRMSPSPANT